MMCILVLTLVKNKLKSWPSNDFCRLRSSGEAAAEGDAVEDKRPSVKGSRDNPEGISLKYHSVSHNITSCLIDHEAHIH